MEKSTEINLNLSDIDFIQWLISRLEYLHGYSKDSDIIKRLINIKKTVSQYHYNYSDSDLDKIISKYFIDFYLIRDDSGGLGYTIEERNNLRNAIKNIVQDIKLNNLPKEILLK